MNLHDIDLAQVIRKYAARGEINGDSRGCGTPRPSRSPYAAIPARFLLPRVWALRNKITAYDAVYIAFAETLDAVPLTHDLRLAAAAGNHARVDLV